MNPSASDLNTEYRQVVRRSFILSGLFLATNGCRLPELQKADSCPALPDSFNGITTVENSALIGYREFFGDTNLIELIDRGIAGNQELKILAQDIRIANNEVLARRGAYFPFLTLGGRAGLEKSSESLRR